MERAVDAWLASEAALGRVGHLTLSTEGVAGPPPISCHSASKANLVTGSAADLHAPSDVPPLACPLRNTDPNLMHNRATVKIPTARFGSAFIAIERGVADQHCRARIAKRFEHCAPYAAANSFRGKRGEQGSLGTSSATASREAACRAATRSNRTSSRCSALLPDAAQLGWHGNSRSAKRSSSWVWIALVTGLVMLAIGMVIAAL